MDFLLEIFFSHSIVCVYTLQDMCIPFIPYEMNHAAGTPALFLSLHYQMCIRRDIPDFHHI